MSLRWARIDWGIGLTLLLAGLAIAMLPPLLALALVLGGWVLIGTLIDPVIGLCLTVGTVLVQALVPLPLGLTVTHVVGAMALGTWLLWGLAQRSIVIELPLLVQWGLFLGALILSAGLTQYNAVDSLKQVVRWVLAFLAYVTTVSLVRTPRKAIWLIATILLAGVIESLIGLQQFLTGAGPFSIGDDIRAYGTIGKPNTFAGFLGMIWPLGIAIGVHLLWRWLQQRSPTLLTGGIVAGGSGLICLAAVGVSFSRGAWVGALAAFVVMGVLAGRKRAVPWLILGALIGLIVIIAPNVLPNVIAERATSITDNLRIFDASRVTVTDDNFAIVERMAHWQAGAAMFLDNPVLGVGPDNFNRAYPSYFVGRWSESQGHAHNYYIHIAAETGLLGWITYISLIGSVLWLSWRAVQATQGGAWYGVAVGCAGIVTATTTHNFFENLHVLNFGIHLSAIWGLLTVLVMKRGWNDVSSNRRGRFYWLTSGRNAA